MFLRRAISFYKICLQAPTVKSSMFLQDLFASPSNKNNSLFNAPNIKMTFNFFKAIGRKEDIVYPILKPFDPTYVNIQRENHLRW